MKAKCFLHMLWYPVFFFRSIHLLLLLRSAPLPKFRTHCGPPVKYWIDLRKLWNIDSPFLIVTVVARMPHGRSDNLMWDFSHFLSSKSCAFFVFLFFCHWSILQAFHQLYFIFRTVRHQTIIYCNHPLSIQWVKCNQNFFCVTVSSRPICHSDWRCSEVGFLFVLFCLYRLQSFHLL